MPSGALTLLHVKGIRISVDYSWFIVLFLVIIWLSDSYKGVAGSDTGAYVLAVASALLFFTSILLHELGHAFMAIRKGIGISGITLWMFGGIARLERDSDSAGTEFKIAVAGPVVTAVIIVVCSAVGILFAGTDDFMRAARTNETDGISGVLAVISWLAMINLLVLAFNLIPAFPLDGGRIARAFVWWRTGDRTRATKFAATLGQGFGYLLIGLGVLVLFTTGDFIFGLWLGVVGYILHGSARSAIKQSEFSSRIEGISVSDVMDREPIAIPAELSIEEALDNYFLRYQWPWFPVVDSSQHFIGLLDRVTADEVPAVERAASTVGDLLARDEGSLAVSEDEPLEALLGNPALRRLGALMAVDEDGRLRGVITVDAVGRALQRVVPEV